MCIYLFNLVVATFVFNQAFKSVHHRFKQLRAFISIKKKTSLR